MKKKLFFNSILRSVVLLFLFLCNSLIASEISIFGTDDLDSTRQNKVLSQDLPIVSGKIVIVGNAKIINSNEITNAEIIYSAPVKKKEVSFSDPKIKTKDDKEKAKAIKKIISKSSTHLPSIYSPSRVPAHITGSLVSQDLVAPLVSTSRDLHSAEICLYIVKISKKYRGLQEVLYFVSPRILTAPLLSGIWIRPPPYYLL